MAPILELPLGRGLGLLLLLVACGLAVWNPGLGRLGGRPIGGRAVAVGLGLAGLVLLAVGTLTTLTLPSYGAALGLAILTAFGLAVWGCARRGIAPEVVVELAILATLGGLFGSRLAYVVQFWDREFAPLPPAAATPGPRRPLLAGETLLLRTAGGEARVVLRGGEGLPALAGAIEAAAAPAGVSVEILVARHRGPDGIVSRPRGLVLRASERGPEAFLQVSGSAQDPLGLPEGRITGRPGRPWRDVLDPRIGGLVYFGGVLGVFLAWGGWLLYRRVPLLLFLDGVAPMFPAGTAIGRWGCLGAGCCWGREAGQGALVSVSYPPFSPAWVQFAQEKLACDWDHVLTARELTPALREALGPALCGDTVPLHATPVYESLGQALVFGLVLLFQRRIQRRPGQSFALMIMLMTVVRFADEHLRRDHDQFWPLLGYPLTVTQAVCLGFFALGGALLGWTSRRAERIPGEPAS